MTAQELLVELQSGKMLYQIALEQGVVVQCHIG
jgi:hypothetical protein